MNQNLTAKLAHCEAGLKRLHSRLKRTTNAISKLEKQRRRLQAKMGPVGLTDLIGKPDQQPIKKPEPKLTVQPVKDDLTIVAEAVKTVEESGLDVPTFLKRQDEQAAPSPIIDTQKMKAERESKIDKKKMPLSGRDAEKFLRQQSDRVTEKREKRDRKFFKTA